MPSRARLTDIDMKTTSTLPPIGILDILRIAPSHGCRLSSEVRAWLAAEEAAQQPPKGHMPWSALKRQDKAWVKTAFPLIPLPKLERMLFARAQIDGVWQWVATPQVLTASQRHELTSEPGEGES